MTEDCNFLLDLVSSQTLQGNALLQAAAPAAENVPGGQPTNHTESAPTQSAPKIKHCGA